MRFWVSVTETTSKRSSYLGLEAFLFNVELVLKALPKISVTELSDGCFLMKVRCQYYILKCFLLVLEIYY